MRTNAVRETLGRREEDPLTIFWTIVVYLFVVGVLAFVAIGLWWLRPHH
jgi:hypothetical protein